MHTATAPLPTAHSAFDGGRGYLAACTTGLPPRASRTAVIADIEAAARGHVDIPAYSATVERARALFAQLVSVDPGRVAIASQASACAALVATAVPDGGEVLVPEGDFSSIVMPFVQAGRGIRVRKHRCDLNVTTERKGSPYTLVCTKNTASYQDRLKKYHADQERLATIRAIEACLPG